ncbi:MAG: YceI family protein, partial [Rhodoferax sp.]
MRLSLLSAAAISLLALGSQAQAANYAIDPTHTYVTFEISHFGTSTNRGRFDKKEGKVAFDRAAKTGKVEIAFDTNSVNTGLGAFNEHLQSAELLDAAKHPKISFVST